MASVREEELNRAKLVALVQVQQEIKECNRNKGKYNLTNKKMAEIIGNSVKWVEKYKTIINKSRAASEEKSDEEIFNNEVISRSRKGKGRRTRFSPAQIREVTVGCANKRRRSVRKSSKRFNNHHNNQTMSKTTVWELRKEAGYHPFHRTNAPMITNMNRQHRCALAQFMLDQFEDGILHPLLLIFTDEFMIYCARKINTKNDVIWALNKLDIPYEIRYNRCPRNPDCIGLFVAIANFGVFYAIKDEGQSWDGEYFRVEIIPSLVQWIKKESDYPNSNVLQHDCAPGWRANATQNLLQDKLGDRFIPSKTDQAVPRWPGNSPDMNVVENFGSVIMDVVDEKIDRSRDRITRKKLISFVEDAIKEAATDPTLITNLLLSFPKRCREIIKTNGAPLKY